MWGRYWLVTSSKIMTTFTSTIQILKVNDVEKGVSKKTGQPWERHTAECVLLKDDGELECVGKLNLPEPLRATAARGVFRAGFSLVVPTFGDQQGQITARLVSLMPVPSKSVPVVPKA